jgi:FAD/FMN-containing dehydrogenase
VVGSGKVTVVGGGHRGNCRDNAIAVNMKRWNTVEVDPSRLIVLVGSGATIDEINRECEKHGLVVPIGDRPGVGMGTSTCFTEVERPRR